MGSFWPCASGGGYGVGVGGGGDNDDVGDNGDSTVGGTRWGGNGVMSGFG